MPCKWYHLVNVCPYGDLCRKDHTEMSQELLSVLRYVTKRIPCTFGSHCYRVDCIFGHVCHNPLCLEEDIATCPFQNYHDIDPELAGWQKAEHVNVHFPLGGLHRGTPGEFVQQSSLRGILPEESNAPLHRIPVNKNEHRLDFHMREPSLASSKAYLDHAKDFGKPCSWFHETGSCTKVEICRYDHSTKLSGEISEVMRYRTRRLRCRLGSECRATRCMFGHICQNTRCVDGVQDGCAFKDFHDVDPTVTSWVEAVEESG